MREFCRVTGQYVPQTRGEVMRCIYESLAMKYKLNFNALCRVSDKHFAQINMLGGGIKDTLLCRLTANATGVRVVAGPTEATVMGNIAVQLIALGELSSWSDARRVITDSTPLKIYEPEECAAWDRAYAEYQKYLGMSAKR